MKKNHSLAYLDHGISAEASLARYRARRENIAKQIGHVACFSAIDNSLANDNPWLQVEEKIYQEPFFLYLTGINRQAGALLLDWVDDKLVEILFLPPKNTHKEFWVGFAFGYLKANKRPFKAIDESYTNDVQTTLIKNLLGFNEVRSLVDLPHFLKKYLLKKKVNHRRLGLFWHQSRTSLKSRCWQDANERFLIKLKQEFSREKSLLKLEYVNIANKTWHERIVLDKVDKINFKRACHWTTNAFIELIRSQKKFSSEHSIGVYLQYLLQRENQFGLSFPIIVASGSNACVLHYTKNDDVIAQNELILIDFGARCYTMHADITRIIPASGRFNPLQKMLYTIVLEAQSLVERLVKPGITIKTVNDKVWSFIDDSLKRRFVDAGGKMKLHYQKMPHSVSHLIGNQVHDGDPFGDYKAKPLEPDCIISNEPGIYGHFSIVLDDVKYDEDIGIRLEDDLLISNDGCINLTRTCPKQIAEIEALLEN